jgi:hypothetical protein
MGISQPKGEVGLARQGAIRCLQAGLFKLFVQEFFQLVVYGELFLFTAFLFKAEQKAFPGRIIVFDLEIHHGAERTPLGTTQVDTGDLLAVASALHER